MVSEQMVEYLILTIMWSIWCLLHSLLIAHTTMKAIKSWIPRYLPFHRVAYNIFSLLTFGLMIHYEGSLSPLLLYEFTNIAELGRIAMFSIGGGLFIAGAKSYDLFQFAGLRQIVTQKTHLALNQEKQFKKKGISALTRHPWYLAAFFVIWFNSKTIEVHSLLTNVIFSIYLVLGTLQEERKLVREFGNDYKQYQKEVSMFFPFKWLMARTRHSANDDRRS